VGAVDSVNGATGVVVLDADDIDDSSTSHKFASSSQLTKLDGVETGATADQTGTEIVSSIDSTIGTGWKTGGGGGTAIAYQATAPTSPSDGDLWIDSDEVVQPVVRSNDITNIVSLTQAAYDALTPDSNTLYYITD